MSNLTQKAFLEEIEYIMYCYEMNGVPRHRLLKAMYSHITEPPAEASGKGKESGANRLQ
jgi:hypothetical protein